MNGVPFGFGTSKIDGVKLGAICKCGRADRSHVIADIHLFKACATKEGTITDDFDAIGQDDGFDLGAFSACTGGIGEGGFADFFNTVGNFNRLFGGIALFEGVAVDNVVLNAVLEEPKANSYNENDRADGDGDKLQGGFAGIPILDGANDEGCADAKKREDERCDRRPTRAKEKRDDTGKSREDGQNDTELLYGRFTVTAAVGARTIRGAA